jgi:hypothetical protein
MPTVPNEEMWGVFLFPFSWASGALDPEGAASHSSVTSIKRYGWSSETFTITAPFSIREIIEIFRYI